MNDVINFIGFVIEKAMNLKIYEMELFLILLLFVFTGIAFHYFFYSGGNE